MKLEIERVDAQIKQTEEYIAVLQPRADKYRRLVDSGITLERSFESAEQNYMQNRQELEALRRQRVQLEGTAVDLGSRLEGTMRRRLSPSVKCVSGLLR